MTSGGSALFAAVAFVLAFAAAAWGENIVFPADAGVVDLTQPPYSIKGDGAADCTDAIQKALDDHKGRDATLYLPNGTYVVSATLKWQGRATRNMLQGQSQAGTVLRLRDDCPGFTNPSSPRPVINTGYFPPQRFRNAIRNITVDTGKGNAGAIGIQFNASNQGQMNCVTIRSGDGSGAIGLDMGYTGDVGPLLVKRLTVEGFDVGVFTAYGSAAQTLEFVTLRNQRVYGWINDGQAIALRGLSSENKVPALWNRKGGGVMTLIDADCRGGSGGAAIVNEAALYARNVKTTGYRCAIDGRNADPAATAVVEHVSDRVLSLFPSSPSSLNLPVEETPDIPWDDPKDWVSIAKYEPKEVTVNKPRQEKDGSTKQAATKVMDWTDAIQQAIDSGASTIYFPRNMKSPDVLGTVHIRNKVRRIIGMEGPLGSESKAVFQLDDGEAPAVMIERFDWMYNSTLIRTASSRPLVIGGCTAYIDVGPGGKVFVEDMNTHMRMAKGSSVWMRQWNAEYTHEARHNTLWPEAKDKGWDIRTHPGNLNDGGTLWVLGMKTEGDGTLLTTINGGKSEILGGLVYANKADNPDKRAYVVIDSDFSLSIAEQIGRNQPFNMVEETRGGAKRLLKVGDASTRAFALYSGHGGSGAKLTTPGPATRAAPKPASAAATATAAAGPQVTFSASAETMPEKGGKVTITVTRQGATDAALTVPLAGRLDFSKPRSINFAARGDAVEGRDYKPLPESVVLPAGAASATFVVEAVDNNLPQPPRKIILAPAPSNLYTAAPPVTITLVDDDTPPAGSGTGLKAEYFAGKDFTDLKATRTDARLAFDWDKKAPVEGQDPQKGYAIRWSGQIEPRFTEVHRIALPMTPYGALTVWLDGKEIIKVANQGTDPKGRFGSESSGVSVASVALEAGRKYDLRVEYVCLNFYGSHIRLVWSGQKQFEEVVPATQLYPAK